MRPKYAWLLLPPALALIVFVGPLQNLSGKAAPPRRPTPSAPADTGTDTTTSTDNSNTKTEVGSNLPQIPDLWQVGSTLIGILLLAGVLVMLVRKLKGRSAPAAGIPSRRDARDDPGVSLKAAAAFSGRETGS